MLLAAPTRLPAVPPDGSEGLTGEMEELPELIPENPIPWHDSLLELPEWMSQEQAEIETRRRPANHGGGLFPSQIWPLQPEPVPGPLTWDSALAKGAEGSAAPRPGVPIPLGPELMALYTAQVPTRVFVDPQNFLRERSGAQMESLLQRWLNDQCAFRTTMLVFGPGQQLPADFDPQALRRQWFGSSEEALLVFYFYGQPERTLAIFGPGARASYGEGVLRAVVDAAVTEAGRVHGDPEQLERFCYKMSVRLHWLVRTRLPGAEGTGISAAAQPRRDWGKTVARAALWSALGISAGLAAVFWRRRWPVPVADEPVLFPERDLCPRLGAPHSGGFSSVISFPRANLLP